MKQKKQFLILAIVLIFGMIVAGCDLYGRFFGDRPGSTGTTGFFEWQIDTDGSKRITNYIGSGGAVTIPPMLNGIAVRSIGERAFQNSQLTSVTIGDNVVKIEDFAFFSNQLTNITFSNNVTYIGINAFGRNRLTNVYIPSSITHIGSMAFVDNPLISIEVAPGNNTFTVRDFFLLSKDETKLINYYGSLINVAIPDGVTEIGRNAFAGTQVTNVTIPDSVITIGPWAFMNAPLINVAIGNGVTHIEARAFQGNQLTSVIIPSNVRFIRHDAFSNNPLISITIGANVVIGGWVTGIPGAFGIWDAQTQTHIPSGFEAAYEASGRAAGTYTRSGVYSTVWTRQ